MRGSIRKRGAGWEITVRAGRDPVTGKPVRRYARARTQDAAEVELTRILRDLDTGSFVDPGRLLLVDYLRERWLPHMATRVRTRTLQRYTELLERHVIPRIGGIRLGKVKPLHVQAVIDAMVIGGRAPRTIAGAYRTLHGALGQAVRWQILSVNVAAAVRPPRAERPTSSVPDPATVGRILAAVRSTRLYVPLVLAATTGMRRGEVLGLRWSSVDLDSGVARVVSSLQDVGSDVQLMPPKTDRGRRTVALPPATVAILRRHRKEQAQRRLLLGEAWHDLGLVIDQGDGRPFSPDALSRAFYRLVRTLGLPGVRLHDLRHAYATALLVGGVHPKIVSEALGHCSVAFTMDVYSHVLPSMQEQAARAIEDALGGALTE